jgi:hypothetical protein
MNQPRKRGHARRERVHIGAAYTKWRLDEEATTFTRYDPQLSPAALWVLLAYLPPNVRRQPWVRHLVQHQLGQAHRRPEVERVQLDALAGLADEPTSPESPRLAG